MIHSKDLWKIKNESFVKLKMEIMLRTHQINFASRHNLIFTWPTNLKVQTKFGMTQPESSRDLLRVLDNAFFDPL